jgi:hypothetical protein
VDENIAGAMLRRPCNIPRQHLLETHQRVVDKMRLEKLEQAERAEAQKLGVEEFKFATNDEMFTAMGF